jgi:hypothetical protein
VSVIIRITDFRVRDQQEDNDGVATRNSCAGSSLEASMHSEVRASDRAYSHSNAHFSLHRASFTPNRVATGSTTFDVFGTIVRSC